MGLSVGLSLAMIVKNEALNLPRCLASVQGVVDEMVILDTGSTDETIDIAQNAGAIVHAATWENNFATARNRVLEYVTGDWVLVLDADEVLRSAIVPLIKTAIAQPDLLVINLLRHEVGAAQSPYSLVSRLFRRHPAIAFRRPYHAMIDDSVEALLGQEPHWKIGELEIVAIDHYGYQPDMIASRDKFTKARTMMEGFLAQNPHDPYVCSKLGALYIEMGLIREGLALLNRGLQFTNHDVATLYELQYHLGVVHAGIGDTDRAVTHYQQALQQPIAPKLKLGAMHNLATLFQDRGELADAQNLYEQVLNIDPNLAIAHCNLGMTYKKMGQFTLAIQHYERAIGIQPDYAAAYQNLGVVLMKMGNIPASLDAFGQAIGHYEKGDVGEADRIRQGLQGMGFTL
jgi:tetratricopeptide (TPR) repeat protein